MSKFFIVALPRSRTYWLANFLGCVHEGFYYYPQYEDFMKSDHDGDSTTCHMHIKDFIKDEKRKVIIHRDIDEVRESLRELFGDSDFDFLLTAQEELVKEDGLHVGYNQIDDRIEEIWSHCRDEQFPTAKYLKTKDEIMNNDFIIEETRRVLSAREGGGT